jgi:hypothetical protein
VVVVVVKLEDIAPTLAVEAVEAVDTALAVSLGTATSMAMVVLVI